MGIITKLRVQPMLNLRKFIIFNIIIHKFLLIAPHVTTRCSCVTAHRSSLTSYPWYWS